MLGAASPAMSVWTEQVSNSPRSLLVIHAVSSEVAWAVGDVGQVVVTVDGGLNWVSRPVNGAGNLRGLFAFDGELSVVADDTGNFWRTTDGGLNWVQVHTGAGRSINGIHFFDAETGWALGDPVGSQFVILETTDGGLTWIPSPNAPPANGPVTGILRCYDWVGTEIGAFGTNNLWVIWRTTNGGAQWDSVRTNVRFQSGMGLSADGTGLLSGNSGEGSLLDRSTDFGESWQAGQHPPQASPLRPIEWIEGTNEVWGATNQTGIFQSTNGGLNWVLHTLAPPATFAALGLSFADITTGWCVGWNLSNNSGRIFKYSATTGIGATSSAPERLEVSTHPNPFTADISFALEIAREEPVDISVYDVTGRAIWKQSGIKPIAGVIELRWDGSDWSGRPVQSGPFFYWIRSGTRRITGTMVKVR
jgi:photosystem II stability/assembly factor-like uncharacterized protein